MNGSDDAVRVTVAHAGDDEVRQAAAIWARATARRDRQPATAEEAVPGIQRRLALDGARLFLARQGDEPVGFAVVAPRALSLEVFYLAVDADAWGLGVGRRLLARVDDHAREIGRDLLELWVINDNERAIRVYESAGWIGTEEVKRDAPSSRPERRFLRRLREAPDGRSVSSAGSG